MSSNNEHDLFICEFSPSEDSSTDFSFAVDRSSKVRSPSFILLKAKGEGQTHLGKIRRVRYVTTHDTGLDLYDVRRVALDLKRAQALATPLNVSISALGRQAATISKLFIDIRDDLLRANSDLSPEYFKFRPFAPDSDLPIQVGDAVATATRMFDPTSKIYKGIQEQEIYDLDIQHFINGPITFDPYGRCFFSKGDRRLIMYKVDRKKLEKCLGIDLVYNYIDEKRCIFVQYKCQQNGGRAYYFNSDRRLDRQLERMQTVPGLAECPNLYMALDDMRLCRCCMYFKLCRRDVQLHHTIPRGAYYPLCVWLRLKREQKGLDVDTRPHLTNDIFSECARAGLIGSTKAQTEELQRLLDPTGADDRVQLVFEEHTVGKNSRAQAPANLGSLFPDQDTDSLIRGVNTNASSPPANDPGTSTDTQRQT